MPIDAVATAQATPDPQAGPAPSLTRTKAAMPPMQPDRVEQSPAGGYDPGAMVRALQQHAAALGSAAATTVGRGAQAASKAALEVVDRAAARMTGLVGVMLSIPGDVPHDAAHGYGHQVSSATATHGPAGATTFEKRIPFTGTTAEGAHAIADVKSNCEPGDFKASGSAAALRSAMRTPVGQEVHHLVEQNQTARFGTEAIQNTANAVNLPNGIHAKISAYYSTKATRVGIDHPGTVRGYVQSKSYAAQRQFGIDTTRSFVNSDKSISPEQKAKILSQLDDLERTNDTASCIPEQK